MWIGRKLPLTLAFGVLVISAFGAGCRGFFVKPTVTAIVISPPTPTIPATNSSGTPTTQQFSAIANFSDGSPPAATPATWTENSSGTVATITSSGLATANGLGQTVITGTSTQNPGISATTTLTVVPANVTSITVTPSSQSTTTGSLINLKAVDQSGNNISASVTWTFTLQGTTTQETGITKTGVVDAILGQQFQVNTLTPAVTFPATLNVVASLTVNGTTISSPSTGVTVTITS